MITIKQSLLTAMVLLASIATANAQNADDIMDKHSKAIGGSENWDKIKTLKLSGSVSQQGMDVNITQTMSMGVAMRMDFEIMGIMCFEIVTPKEGWMYMPIQGGNKIDTMKPEMVKALQPQLDMKGNQMLDYKARGTKAEYGGMDTVSNAPCYKIVFTDKEGNKSTSFFEKATYYLLRTEAKIKNDDQEMEVAVLYNNYKKMDEGVVMPMSVSAQGAEINFKTVELNKPIDESIFKPTLPGTPK